MLLAQNPVAEMQATARLRPMLAARGFGPDVVDGPMMARARVGDACRSHRRRRGGRVDRRRATGGVADLDHRRSLAAMVVRVVTPADHLALVAEVQALRTFQVVSDRGPHGRFAGAWLTVGQWPPRRRDQ